jgi:hypothetical protein
LEEVLDGLLLRAVAVDQVFACAAENDLSSDADLRIFFESDWGLLLVAVIEDDCDACFRYSGLSALVYEVLNLQHQQIPQVDRRRSTHLEILRADCCHIRNTQNETY